MRRQSLVIWCMLALMWIGSALHVNHQQAQQYNQKVELNVLSRQQEEFEKKVAQISSELEDLTKSLADSNNDTQKVLLL